MAIDYRGQHTLKQNPVLIQSYWSTRTIKSAQVLPIAAGLHCCLQLIRHVPQDMSHSSQREKKEVKKVKAVGFSLQAYVPVCIVHSTCTLLVATSAAL
jgi:hypothetical protein